MHANATAGSRWVADEAVARRAAHALLSGSPLLPGLAPQQVERAKGRRGADRHHGPWIDLILPGAEVRLALIGARVVAFARGGLVPPAGDEEQARLRPRIPAVALLFRASQALARWGGTWSPQWLRRHGMRRAWACFRGETGELADVLLDAHSGVVLAVSLRRP